MRILPFPDRSEEERAAEEAWLAGLDAALSGEREDAAAAEWRQLANDVRSLPPAISEDFELSLQQRLDEWRTQSSSRSFEMGALLSAAAAVIVALVLVAPWRSSSHSGASGGKGTSGSGAASASSGAASASSGAVSASSGAASASSGAVSASSGAVSASSGAVSEGPPGAAGPVIAAPGGAPPPASNMNARPETFGPLMAEEPSVRTPERARVQQLAASVTLATTTSAVQRISGRVSQVTTGDGGFVQSSRVEVSHRTSSEAHLTLRIPSAKLGEALASLEALAPVQAKSQSLQDITGEYQAAKRGLADAKSQRQALLRAVAKALTEAEIESLHMQLSQASNEVARASDALQGVTRRGQIATVEVTILGNSHAHGASGLTIQRGLHDAEQALTISLVVLLLALSILTPIALVLAGLALARRTWRRHSRERSLDPA